jgi:O-antigen ligase
VTTLFGHPLVNGLIFAMAGTVAAANFVERRGRPQIALCQFATIAGAVLATHSRGPAIALGGGVLVVVGFSRSRARGTGGRRFLIAAGAVCTAGIIVIGLQARNQSQTGQASAALRQAVVSEAFQAIKPLEPFGAGPGQAEQYRTAELLPGTGGNGNYHPLENSYAELLVSIGPVGLLLFLTLIGLPTVRALRNPDTVGEGAALCAWLIAVAGFNAIEGFPAVLVLAALFISTFTPVDASELTFAGATRPRPDAATPSQTHQSKTRSLKAPASG